MTKRIAPLESSREIYHPSRISSNSETIKISRFLKKLHNWGTSDHVALGGRAPGLPRGRLHEGSKAAWEAGGGW